MVGEPDLILLEKNYFDQLLSLAHLFGLQIYQLVLDKSIFVSTHLCPNFVRVSLDPPLSLPS